MTLVRCTATAAIVLSLFTLTGCHSDSIFGNTQPVDVADPNPLEPTTDWKTWSTLGFNDVGTAFAPGTSIPDVCRKSIKSGTSTIPNRAQIVTAGLLTGCNLTTGRAGDIRSNCKTFQYSTTLDPKYPIALGCRHFTYTVRRVVNVDGKFVTGKIVGQVDPASCLLSLTIEDDLPTDRIQITTTSDIGTIPNACGSNVTATALFDCNRASQ